MLGISLYRLLAIFAIVAWSNSFASADTIKECANQNTSASERITACDAALRSSAELRAKLLIQRAQSRSELSSQVPINGAMADLKGAEQLVPNMKPTMRTKLLLQRSELHRLSGEFDKAYADLEEAQELSPDLAEPVTRIALLLFSQGNQTKGYQQLFRALELEPDNAMARFYAMRMAQFRRDPLACVDYGNLVLKDAPTDARVLAMRARCLADLGRNIDAEADLANLTALKTSNAIVYQDMAMAFLALKQPANAVAAARSAIETDPFLVDSYFELITALMSVGDADEALAVYRSFQKIGVDDRVGVANNLAWSMYLVGRAEDSLKITEEWLEQYPEPINEPNHFANADGYAILLDTRAHALTALGRKEDAVNAFLQAVDLSPQEFRSRYNKHLRQLGFVPDPDNSNMEAALLSCVATGEACKLYTEN